jgi:anaerobic magnesium-protoporphyrin IX monomethyl ester cyclase
MKILLLNPPTKDNKKFIREGRCTQESSLWTTIWPPISLATIGALLENDEHIVKVNDCSAEAITHSALKNIIYDFSPYIIIWSSGTPSIQSDLELSSFIKALNSSIKTATFGTHVTVLAQDCLQEHPDLDFIIRNEPEYTIRELVFALEKNRGYRTINGLSYRDSDNHISHNPDRAFIENLNELPMPAWHLVNLDCYRMPLKGHRFIIVSPLRGCPYECTFCTTQTYYGNKVRKRSPERVVQEIEYNIENYNIKNFFFWADTFTLDKKYVKNLCRLIMDKELNISWVCNSRVDTVDEEMLKHMADAGCWMISYGIESGCQKVLDICKKKITVEQTIRAVELTEKVGIKTVGHFIIGLPGETIETAQETINFAHSLPLDFAQFYSAVPFPGSKLYEMAKQNQWIQNNNWGKFNQTKVIMNLPDLKPLDADKLIKKAYKSFYYRPKKISAALKMIRFSTIWNSLVQANHFIKSLFIKQDGG